MTTRCSMCFKDKGGLMPPTQGMDGAPVCKGCFYEIDRVAGFLAYHGWGLMKLLPTPTVAVNPPTPQKQPEDGQETPPKAPRRSRGRSEG